MRLYDDVRTSVCFLGHAIAGDDVNLANHPRATGFFVQHEGAHYIVTAAHVAKALEDAPFAVRLNDKDGNARVDRISEATWWYHPTDTENDVAVVAYEMPDWADTSPWVVNWFMTKAKQETKNIGAGDLAYIVGLYLYVPGAKKNTPIVHTGHIAMMEDEEPIPAEDWRAPDPKSAPSIQIKGYLVEAETFEGLSGSPVFVRRSVRSVALDLPVDRKLKPGEKAADVRVWIPGAIWLMGVWHGAWYGDPAEGKKLPTKGKVPVGIGLVTPAEKIIDVLNRDELREIREKMKAADDKRRAITPTLKSGGRVFRGD